MAWDVTVKENATIEDTLTLIVQAVNQCSGEPYAQEVAKKLNITNSPESFKRLFYFVKSTVEYVNDTDGIERVYTPDRTIREGRGDCKKMTVLIASVLKAAGINPILKHVVYGPREKWTHIYTIVSMVSGWPTKRSDYYVLDPTIPGGAFNQEVSYKSGMMMNLNGETSKNMDLHMMGKSNNMSKEGTPFAADIAACHGSLISAAGGVDTLIGGPTNIFAKLHPVVAAHLKAAGKITPMVAHEAVTKALFPHGAPPHAANLINVPYDQQRGAFLQLIKQNVDGIAGHLLQTLGQDPKALDNVWHIVGGDINALKTEIMKAAKLPPVSSDSETAVGANGTLIGKGFFKKLLHGASVILHAVAPIVNSIIPGAGVALNNIANKAENISNNIPVRNPKTGELAPPPPHADIPIDKNGIPFGNRIHGGSFGFSVEPGPWYLTAMKCFIWGSLMDLGIHHQLHIVTNSTLDTISGLVLTGAVVVSAILAKYGRF